MSHRPINKGAVYFDLYSVKSRIDEAEELKKNLERRPSLWGVVHILICCAVFLLVEQAFVTVIAALFEQ